VGGGGGEKKPARLNVAKTKPPHFGKDNCKIRHPHPRSGGRKDIAVLSTRGKHLGLRRGDSKKSQGTTASSLIHR